MGCHHQPFPAGTEPWHQHRGDGCSFTSPFVPTAGLAEVRMGWRQADCT